MYSNEKAGMILCDLIISLKYNKNDFKYYSNKIISSGKFLFEEANISCEAQREGLSERLWELSKDLINSNN